MVLGISQPTLPSAISGAFTPPLGRPRAENLMLFGPSNGLAFGLYTIWASIDPWNGSITSSIRRPGGSVHRATKMQDINCKGSCTLPGAVERFPA